MSASTMTHVTFAVVVVYMPDSVQLGELCKVISVDASVIVVDNTPGGAVSLGDNLCVWISNGENLGVATAQNIGVREALRRGAHSIVFFDQDSQLSLNTLPALMEGLRELGVGVVAPVCRDSVAGIEYPSFRLNRLGWPLKVYSCHSRELTAVDTVISSGSLVSSDVFARAGLLDDSLFIDYVDFEWCLRVRGAGIKIVVNSNAVMNHSIGQCSVSVAGLNVFVHRPERCYYRVRNAFHLFGYRHVPFLYSVKMLVSALVHHVLQCRHSDSPIKHMRMGLLAIKDGLIGRRGGL